MRFNRFNRYVAFLAVACSLLLLSACAPTQKKENQVEARATARWDALLAGDLNGAYQYLSPGYRSSVTSLQYQRSILVQQLRWNSAEYLDSQCDETTCNVRFLVGFTVYAALPGVKSYDGTQRVDESWVLADGDWYMVPKR